MAHLSSNPKRGVIRFPRGHVPSGSSAIASEAHRNVFQLALASLLEDISLQDDLGYFSRFQDFAEQNTNLTDAWLNAAIVAVAAPVGDPTPPKPNWMSPLHYNLIVAMYGPVTTAGTVLAVAVGGAGAPAPLVPIDPPVLHIDQVDYDYVFLQFLFNLCHSGAVSEGVYRQRVTFTLFGLPKFPDEHVIEMSQLVALLPSGITPLNFCNAYADFIATNAKANNTTFDWGRNHGAVGIPGHIGFPSWRYLSNEHINDDQREILRLASAAAIRDKRKQKYEDPSYLEVAEEENSKLAAEQLAHIHANRENLTRYSLAPHVILRNSELERQARESAELERQRRRDRNFRD
jgi:hypothetical protein